ncbi:MAG: ABC transporter permease [Christensenellales bacterium]
MENILGIICSTEFFYSIFRVTTPILLAALGAMITSRAGVVNIGLEGIMLFSALAGVVTSAWTQSAAVGLLAAILVGVLISALMAYVMLVLRSDITLTGFAVNALGSGCTVFLLYVICNDKGISSSLASKVLPKVNLPLIQDIPFVGKVLSGHNIMTYVAFLLIIVIYWLVNKTPLGLRIRAVGENPHAAESVGIKVTRIQLIAMLISGVLAGMAGAYMSMGYVSWFARDMMAGRGFIALAAQQLGQGTVVGSMLASLAFGAADSLANNLQALRLPSEFVQSIPYAVTIVGLVIYSASKKRREQRLAAGK